MPRRVYTQSHADYVVEVFQGIVGMRERLNGCAPYGSLGSCVISLPGSRLPVILGSGTANLRCATGRRVFLLNVPLGRSAVPFPDLGEADLVVSDVVARPLETR